MLQIGGPAPAINLAGTQGDFSSRDYLGKTNLVLIFYPKDNTPG